MQRLAGSGASATQRQSKRPLALCPSAPGSRPARVSTWNPLQIPMTGRPLATNARRRSPSRPPSPAMRSRAEHAAGAEGVAVAEPAGDDDDAGVVEQLRPGDQLGGEHDRRLGAGEVEGEHGVGVAVRARPGDDEGGRPAHAVGLR